MLVKTYKGRDILEEWSEEEGVRYLNLYFAIPEKRENVGAKILEGDKFFDETRAAIIKQLEEEADKLFVC